MSSNPMTRIAGAAVLGAALLIGTLLSAPPAQAQPSSFNMTLTEEGSNVVATGSGTINTIDLHLEEEESTGRDVIQPNVGLISTGPTGFTETTIYTDLTGPADFGTGTSTFPDSGSGMRVAIDDPVHNELEVPLDYVSGSSLTSTSTWDDATFASLGVTPGTYEWTWGSGPNAGTFTLKAEEAAVPEPATLGLMVLGLLGAVFAGRKRRS